MRHKPSSTSGSLIVAAITLLLAGCDACGSTLGNTTDAADGDAGECATTCADGEVCRYQTCVPDPPPCDSTDDCEGDFYCDLPAGECLPWGVGPGGLNDADCTREVVAGVFFPDVQCEWPGPPADDPYPDHKNVLGTPMVADFKAYGDPELGRPSIVFISYNYTDGSTESCVGSQDELYFGVVRVLDGRTCEQQATIATPHPIASSSLALGDLTGDGIPEIVAAKVGGGLVAWQHSSGGEFDILWNSTSTFGSGQCNWAGPSIHDLDDDGVPEVLLYGGVFDASLTEIDTSLGVLSTDLATGYVPVVADVDADGQPELVTGAAIYGWSSASNSWQLEHALGATNAQTAIADFGSFAGDLADDDRTTLDGVAEVVTVNLSTVTLYNLAGRVLFSATLPGAVPVGNGGPPTIADFDGDGRVEFAAAGGTAYAVFDIDCQGTPAAATCPTLATDGILWWRESQDLSSNKTGSSVFDFEGDGIAEAVYGDECFTRVYEGPTGEVMYSRYRTSCTWYEYPIIADVDNDFGAEIVITSNNNCARECPALDPIFDGIRCFDEADCPGTTSCVREEAGDEVGRCRCTVDQDCGGDGFVCLDPLVGSAGKVCRAAHPGPSTAFGLRVVGDKLGRWVATRPIWNQHAYAVTNVEASGRIPRTSEWLRNWESPGLNNFRQNSPGDGAGAGIMPDLTVGHAEASCSSPGNASISIEVCNRGTEPVSDGLQASVYDGATLICTAETTAILWPGACAVISCDTDAAPQDGSVDFTIVVDDDGAGTGSHTECRESNNQLVLEGVSCP